LICLAPRVPGEIVGPRRLSGVVVRPLNFTVMRLAKNPRTLAAISFAWPTLLCLATLAILWGTPGPAPLGMSLELSAVVILSVVLAATLFSRASFSRPRRLLLLFICVGATLASLFFAQVLLLGWIFPLWYVFRFYREPAA
jgi:hypothetical protein